MYELITLTGEVTSKDFAELAKQRGWSLDFLVSKFRDLIEEPREYFERLLKGRWNREARGDVVIPYRSVLQFYFQERKLVFREGACACGCGVEVSNKKWASPTCRKRAQRRGSLTPDSASVNA